MDIRKIKLIILITALGVSGNIKAQNDTTLTREVEVVKEYIPKIVDANKISEMPGIEEVKHEKPSFEYSIFSQPIYNTFSVSSLKAATLSSYSKKFEGMGLVKAGFGNYSKPYAEVFINNRNDRSTIFGIHGKHISSHGKIKLEEGSKVEAPFSENNLELFWRNNFRKTILSMDMGVDHRGFKYYGYPLSTIPDALKGDKQKVNFFGEKQTFTKGIVNIGLKNKEKNRSEIFFDFDLLYHYFTTKTKQKEHFVSLSSKLKKQYGAGWGNLNAKVNFVNENEIYKNYIREAESRSQTFLMINPFYELKGDFAALSIGAKTWLVFDSTDVVAKISPDIRANITPVKGIVDIFAGVDGNYESNYYSKIAYENQFVNPFHCVKNSFERLHFFGGIDGKLTPKMNYKILTDYSNINDYHFFCLNGHPYDIIASENYIIDNDFDVIYDDVDILKFNVEIYYLCSDKINVLASGDYYVYDLKELGKPWNLPEWEAKLSVNYKLSEQLSMSSDLFLTGQREALIKYFPGQSPVVSSTVESDRFFLVNYEKQYKLPAIFDFNINADYRINSHLSIFAYLNNMGFKRYQKWLGYPVQSFNLLGGVSYTF